MKKKIITLGLGALFLGVFSCSQSGKTSEDTATGVETLTETTETVVEETEEEAPEVEVVANPEANLALKVVNKNLRYADESSAMTGSLTVEVTNNGKAAISGSDYEVTYQEKVEEDVGGEFLDVTKSRTTAGKDIGPGASVTIKLPASAGCQDISSPAIKALNK